MSNIQEKYANGNVSLCSNSNDKAPSPRPVPFFMSVPDYVQVDWTKVRPSYRPSTKGRKGFSAGLYWAIHQAVIFQKKVNVILADVILGQIFWGGDKKRWPRNWRNRMVNRLKDICSFPDSELVSVVHRERDTKQQECPNKCPLFNSRIRHQHLEITISSLTEVERIRAQDPQGPGFQGAFLGAMDVFRVHGLVDQDYDWSPPKSLPEYDGDPYSPEMIEGYEKHLAFIKKMKRQGVLSAIYFNEPTNR